MLCETQYSVCVSFLYFCGFVYLLFALGVNIQMVVIPCTVVVGEIIIIYHITLYVRLGP